MFLTSIYLALRTAVIVAKLVILGISPLTTIILTLNVRLVATLVISGILSSIFLILALYKSLLQHHFLTTSLSLLKLTGKASNLLISSLSLLLFKLLKLPNAFLNLSISN